MTKAGTPGTLFHFLILSHSLSLSRHAEQLKSHSVTLNLTLSLSLTPGLRQIGDFARAKDTLSELIVDIDTRIY